MTTLTTKKCKCSNCGAELHVRVVMSTNSMGSPDLDLRPPQMQRSTMPFWVQECNGCGYVNSDIEKDAAPYKELIKSNAYKSCEGNRLENPLSRRFYRFALIMEKDNMFGNAYSAFLRAAWASDDSCDCDDAIICRKRALSIYDRTEDAEDENRMVQRADLLRRAGEFDKLTGEYSDFSSDTEILRDIVAFHLDRAKCGDSGCYRVEDIYKAQ